MAEDKQKLCSLLLPVLREMKGLYHILDLEYIESRGLVYAVSASGFQKVIDVDGLSKEETALTILKEMAEERIQTEGGFQRFLEEQRKAVEAWKKEELGFAEILFRLTSRVADTAGEPYELSFTASQLEQLFDLALRKPV